MTPTDINKLKIKMRAKVLSAGETAEYFNVLVSIMMRMMQHIAKCKEPDCPQGHQACVLDEKIRTILGNELYGEVVNASKGLPFGVLDL